MVLNAQEQDVPSIPKPKRVWLLQALAALQLLSSLIGVIAAFSAGLPDLPALDLALGFAKPAVALLLLPAVILSLQRLLPKPQFLAPLLVAVWLVFTIAVIALSTPPPQPAAVQALQFENVSPVAERVGKVLSRILGLAALLWVVTPLFVAGPTRAYLAAKSP